MKTCSAFSIVYPIREEYDMPSKSSLLGVPVELTLCGGGRAVKQGAVLEAVAVTGSLGQRGGELVIVP